MNWPHAPTHWLFEPGLYIVTAGTYRKPNLNSPARLDFFQKSLFEYANEFGWNLRAWALLANHYHFVAASPTDPKTLRKFLGKLRMQTSKQFNRLDHTPGRTVWFQFWASHITFERSYLARLNYVHYNPARHGVVPLAENYKWCSASWFAENAPPAFVSTGEEFKGRSGQRAGRFLILGCADMSALSKQRHVAAVQNVSGPRPNVRYFAHPSV